MTYFILLATIICSVVHTYALIKLIESSQYLAWNPKNTLSFLFLWVKIKPCFSLGIHLATTKPFRGNMIHAWCWTELEQSLSNWPGTLIKPCWKPPSSWTLNYRANKFPLLFKPVWIWLIFFPSQVNVFYLIPLLNKHFAMMVILKKRKNTQREKQTN